MASSPARHTPTISRPTSTVAATTTKSSTPASAATPPKTASTASENVLRLHPAIVIVEFGGNDGLRGIPIADTRRNLSTIVSTLLQGGGKVILAGITLPPNYGADYIEQFDETYRLVAAKFRVPLLPELYAHVYAVPGAIQDDGIHPTAKGAQLVADNFLPLLLPLLHK